MYRCDVLEEKGGWREVNEFASFEEARTVAREASVARVVRVDVRTVYFVVGESVAADVVVDVLSNAAKESRKAVVAGVEAWRENLRRMEEEAERQEAERLAAEEAARQAEAERELREIAEEEARIAAEKEYLARLAAELMQEPIAMEITYQPDVDFSPEMLKALGGEDDNPEGE